MLIYKAIAFWFEVGKINNWPSYQLWVGNIIIGKVGYKDGFKRFSWEAEIVEHKGEYTKVLGWKYETKEAAMEAVQNYYEITEEEND